jgi:hypothetical protein
MNRSLFRKLVKWRSRYRTIKEIERRHADEQKLQRHDDIEIDIDKAVDEMKKNHNEK